MKHPRLTLAFSSLLLASLACNLATGINIAKTEVPAMMTSAPTVLGPMGTAAAEFTPPALPTQGTAVPGTLGISLDDVKTVLDASNQFTLKEVKTGGQPASVATLSSSAAANLPGLAETFSASFIGDPASLSEIKIVAPYSQDKTAITGGLTLVTALFTSILPPDVSLAFIPWITQNYSTVQPGTPQVLTVRTMKFNLSRTQTIVTLDITPLQ